MPNFGLAELIDKLTDRQQVESRHWKLQGERCSLSDLGIQLDLAVVKLHYFEDRCETNSAAVFFSSIVQVKDLFTVLGRDPHALILYPQFE